MATTLDTTFRTIITEVNERFIDRADMIDAIAVAIVGKLNGLSISPPGCAKTQIGEELYGRIDGAKVFEESLAKAKSEQFVIGPIDISTYREKGFMVRYGKGYLQESDYGRIEEIGRAQNSTAAYLLPLLNERLFHEANENGKTTIKTPLRNVYATSNSFLVEEDGDQDNAAFNDRFHLKVIADRITDKSAFMRLLHLPDTIFTGVKTTISHTELSDVQDNVVPRIAIGPDVFDKMFSLKRELSSEHILPSDRQWLCILHAAKASAWIRGSKVVTARDLRIARFMVWEFESQHAQAHDIVNELCGADPAVVVEARKLRVQVNKEMTDDPSNMESAIWGARAAGTLYAMIEKLRKAQAESSMEDDRSSIDGEIKLTEGLRNRIIQDVMGVDAEGMPSL